MIGQTGVGRNRDGDFREGVSVCTSRRITSLTPTSGGSSMAAPLTQASQVAQAAVSIGRVSCPRYSAVRPKRVRAISVRRGTKVPSAISRATTFCISLYILWVCGSTL